MSQALLLQYLIVAVAVLFSAVVVFKKQFPATTRRLRGFLALPLLRAGRPRWMHAFGQYIAPPAVKNVGGCGGCSNCGSNKP